MQQAPVLFSQASFRCIGITVVFTVWDRNTPYTSTHLLLYYNLYMPPIYSYITTCMCHPSTLILQLTCSTHLLLYYNLHAPPIYSYITICMCHSSTLILQLVCATHLFLYCNLHFVLFLLAIVCLFVLFLLAIVCLLRFTNSDYFFISLVSSNLSGRI
jgi:hypothetical protein